MAFALLCHLQHRVQLRENGRLSAADIREALMDVQSTIMKDVESGKMYCFPKKIGETLKKIYRSLGIWRNDANTEVLSISEIEYPEPLSWPRHLTRRGSSVSSLPTLL